MKGLHKREAHRDRPNLLKYKPEVKKYMKNLQTKRMRTQLSKEAEELKDALIKEAYERMEDEDFLSGKTACQIGENDECESCQ